MFIHIIYYVIVKGFAQIISQTDGHQKINFPDYIKPIFFLFMTV